MFNSANSEHTMDFIKTLAAEKAERSRSLCAARAEVATTLHEFHKNQTDMLHSMMAQFNENQKLRAKAETMRRQSCRQFEQELDKENSARIAAGMERARQVKGMRSDFQSDFAATRKDLAACANTLHTSLRDGEKQRMSSFNLFHNMLEQKKKERSSNIKMMAKQTGIFMDKCRAGRERMGEDLRGQFAAAAKARQEIMTAWTSLHSGRMPGATMKHATMPAQKGMSQADQGKTDHSSPGYSKTNPSKTDRSAADHGAMPGHPMPHGTMPEQSMPEAEAPQPDMSHTGTERLSKMKLKLKATISSFPKGCRFSEIQRSLGNADKDQIKKALMDLLASQELRKDDQDRYHLI